MKCVIFQSQISVDDWSISASTSVVMYARIINGKEKLVAGEMRQGLKFLEDAKKMRCSSWTYHYE